LWADLSVVYRCGGGLHRLALAVVGLSGGDGGQLFLPDPDPSIFLGWMFLGESVGPALLGAAALVAAGIVLINRRTPTRRIGDAATP
jgi:hypothetical protein